MDSDQEVNASDVEATKRTFASSAKGKGKAVDRVGQDASQDETLPWSALLIYPLLLGLFSERDLACCRVEKYRPVSLDDVVSHKDITSTSTSWLSSSGMRGGLVLMRFVARSREVH